MFRTRKVGDWMGGGLGMGQNKRSRTVREKWAYGFQLASIGIGRHMRHMTAETASLLWYVPGAGTLGNP
ncbi:hypothetical protein MPNT_330021 [Candidatus Methylacidithermus pantelleriae]|uniref:Uncharacterized protein n=1 Tax=Candidatus Methylacidithermus pantelleriae TaxID=2744239 RepID=A0A8J2FSQ1_9BACT|nr:hypothetical protein MPNT_330021 [Candidatus Methylacidithermus pantelleriae]